MSEKEFTSQDLMDFCINEAQKKHNEYNYIVDGNYSKKVDHPRHNDFHTKTLNLCLSTCDFAESLVKSRGNKLTEEEVRKLCLYFFFRAAEIAYWYLTKPDEAGKVHYDLGEAFMEYKINIPEATLSKINERVPKVMLHIERTMNLAEQNGLTCKPINEWFAPMLFGFSSIGFHVTQEVYVKP